MNIESIIDFISKNQGVRVSKINGQVDLNVDLGIDGDDFSDLIEAYAKEFNVNIDAYCWYFHHRDEGWNVGALFFKPPYKQVDYIPVTPDLLLRGAISHTWPIEYPAHELPSSRADISFNYALIVFFIVICGLAVWLF